MPGIIGNRPQEESFDPGAIGRRRFALPRSRRLWLSIIGIFIFVPSGYFMVQHMLADWAPVAKASIKVEASADKPKPRVVPAETAALVTNPIKRLEATPDDP